MELAHVNDLCSPDKPSLVDFGVLRHYKDHLEVDHLVNNNLKMPLASLDDYGVVFDYDDTGAPPGSTDYTTLVIVHGIQFNNGIFFRLKPYAASANLRLVLLNLREHGRSTPYSDDEAKILAGSDLEQQAAFMKQRVKELAAFFAWFIQKENIPLKKEVNGKKTGGFSWIAWSGGNAYSVSFFGFPEVIPEHERQLIERYLRSYVMYDPAHPLVGAPVRSIDELYNVFFDPAIPAADKDPFGPYWVPKLIGKHSGSAQYAYDALSVDKLADLPPLLEYLGKLQTLPDPLELDLAPLNDIAEVAAVWRSFMPIISIDPSKFYEPAFQRALTQGFNGEKSDSEKAYFPDVKFEYVGMMQSLPETVYSSYWVKRMLLQYKERGTKTRDFHYRIFKDVAHGWHWDEPEKVIELFASIA
ncbi:hypothetical protein EIP91_004448 [Steccherinum ochraceum]|uniref:AB hydrolase-1 domain-containing protein n=1 Tax=Steccherinum ochraceum TaxID=92696 RepID=A0A4R0RBC3_9APHY|nr:hypothetical protein EIP91_004448 [Steccherinum ochraceum]